MTSHLSDHILLTDSTDLEFLGNIWFSMKIYLLAAQKHVAEYFVTFMCVEMRKQFCGKFSNATLNHFGSGNKKVICFFTTKILTKTLLYFWDQKLH